MAGNDVSGVLVLCRSAGSKTPVSCSGIRLSNKWVLTTGSVLSSIFQSNGEKGTDQVQGGLSQRGVTFSVITCEKPAKDEPIHSKIDTFPADNRFKIIKSKCDDPEKLPNPQRKSGHSSAMSVCNSAPLASPDAYKEFSAHVLFSLKCPLVSECLDTILSSWVMGSTASAEENMDSDSKIARNLMPLFLILKLHSNDDKNLGKTEFSDLVAAFHRALDPYQNALKRGQGVVVESTPFGNYSFFNSISEGIISNVVGPHGCVLLTDARTAIGSEGGPIFAIERKNDVTKRHLIGMVVCSFGWWHGEWVGFTLGASLSSVLRHLIKKSSCASVIPRISTNLPTTDFIAGIDDCVVLVRCGTGWGSGVVVDSAKGIIITNTHVVQKAKDKKARVHCRGRSYPADVVFTTTSGLPYDVAVLTVGPGIPFRSAVLCTEVPTKGDPVIAAGFPLFSEHDDVRATVTRGIIAHVSEPISVLQTTSCIQSGASGGGLFGRTGRLKGLIVCNILDTATGGLYPRINMAVPAVVMAPSLHRFLQSGDINDLSDLESKDPEVQKLWRLQTIMSRM